MPLRCPPRSRLAALCAGAMLLSGCGIGRSDTDRINAAQPIPASIVAAKAAADKATRWQPAQAKDIADGYDQRMKERAVQCSRGYQPSIIDSEQAIHQQLADKDCFDGADRDLLDWLARKRIGLLLAAPPLRPVPALAPSVIQAGDAIVRAEFAERAGIVVVQEPRRYEVIDVGSGATIGHGPTDSAPAQAVSPNGRLFVVGHGADAEVRETETGDLLATIPRIDPSGFHWVNDVGAIYKPGWTPGKLESLQRNPVFIDYTSGQELEIPMASGAIDHVLAVPGKDARFALLVDDRVAEVRLTHNATRWDIALVSDNPTPPMVNWGAHSSGLTADGSTFFGASQQLEVLSLANLSTQDIPLDPLRLRDAVATPDPDRLLLSGDFTSAPGQGVEYSLYSLGGRTMSKVDPARLLSDRVIYIASLHRNAAIQNSRIVLLDGLPAAPAMPINDYLDMRERAVNTLEDIAHPPALVQPLRAPEPEFVRPSPPPSAVQQTSK